MLSTIWSYIKAPFAWVQGVWLKFEAWVATWTPNLKTKMVTGLGALGTSAAFLQEYMTGLPLDKFITGTQLAIVSAVLFTLAFWFRRLTSYNT